MPSYCVLSKSTKDVSWTTNSYTNYRYSKFVECKVFRTFKTGRFGKRRSMYKNGGSQQCVESSKMKSNTT